MVRNDLLSLTDDDLAAITNRGTVKRARREHDGDELTCEIDPGEALVVRWSDGTTCTFPVGKTIEDAVCSSGAIGVSRHVIRSVMAYQAWHAVQDHRTEQNATEATKAGEPDVEPEPDADSDSHPGQSWCPGDITDDQLIKHFRSAAITRAKKIYAAGVLVELTRGAKPTARFLHQSCTVRFPVPGDPRYARADCDAKALPTWVAMAVWSFRSLPADRQAGLVCLGDESLSIPREPLARVQPLVNQWITEGISGLPGTWKAKWQRATEAVHDAGLIWPAELMNDLERQHTAYAEKDARFDPQEVLRLMGEWIARARAMTHPTPDLPQALVRGNRADVPTPLRATRLVGLGLDMRPGPKHVHMAAYFQDSESGNAAVIRRTLAIDDDSLAFNWDRLLLHALARGISIGAASMSQLMIAGGKRSPNDELILPRRSNRLTTNPQSFRWEQLLPPLWMDDFMACRERLEMLPPDYLRPRRLTENLHVFPVCRVRDVSFDPLTQNLIATLEDANGQAAQLRTPYYAGNAAAFNEFQNTLAAHADFAKFVSGRVSLRQGTIVIEPLAVVIEKDGHRFATCPAWAAPADEVAESPPMNQESVEVNDPMSEFLGSLRNELAEILVVGFSQADPATWKELHDQAMAFGFLKIADQIGEIAEQLLLQQNQRHGSLHAAIAPYRELVLIIRLLDA